MLRLFRFNTIRGRIRAFTLTMVLTPILVGLLVFIFVSERAFERDYAAGLDRALGLQRLIMERWLMERSNDILQLAELPATRRGDRDDMAAAFKTYLGTQKDFSNVGYADASGKSVVDAKNPSGLNLADRAYFLAARRGQPFISELITGRATGRKVIVVSAPVRGLDGKFAGAIFGALTLDSIAGFLSESGTSFPGVTYLTTPEGLVLAVSRVDDVPLEPGARPRSEDAKVILDAPPVRAAMDNRRLEKSYTNGEGAHVVGSYAWIDNGRWLLVAEAPLSGIMHAATTYISSVTGASLLVLLLLTPFILRFVRGIERPLMLLSTLSRRVLDGDLDLTRLQRETEKAPQELQEFAVDFINMSRRLRESIDRLETISATDELTGLSNRRMMMREGPRLLQSCVRSGQPCCCLMIDLDHFKAVNDTRGHSVGDDVLRHVADVIREQLRGSDLLARIGGEEFAVVAPNSDLAAGAALAERIREAVDNRPCPAPEEDIHITVSVGVAEYSTIIVFGTNTFDDLLIKADKGLYEAKHAGRNRVSCFGGACRLPSQTS